MSTTTLGERVRGDFDVLKREVHGHPLVYLDTAATSLKPNSMLQASCCLGACGGRGTAAAGSLRARHQGACGGTARDCRGLRRPAVSAEPHIQWEGCECASCRHPLQEMHTYYHSATSNIHKGVEHTLSGEATEHYEAARKKVAAFINANRSAGGGGIGCCVTTQRCNRWVAC